MINEFRRVFKIDCPECGVNIGETYVKSSAKQKYVTETCKNGHEFLLDKGWHRCRAMKIEYEFGLNNEALYSSL